MVRISIAAYDCSGFTEPFYNGLFVTTFIAGNRSALYAKDRKEVVVEGLCLTLLICGIVVGACEVGSASADFVEAKAQS